MGYSSCITVSACFQRGPHRRRKALCDTLCFVRNLGCETVAFFLVLQPKVQAMPGHYRLILTLNLHEPALVMAKRTLVYMIIERWWVHDSCTQLCRHSRFFCTSSALGALYLCLLPSLPSLGKTMFLGSVPYPQVCELRMWIG